jgi:hypothetical protein
MLPASESTPDREGLSLPDVVGERNPPSAPRVREGPTARSDECGFGPGLGDVNRDRELEPLSQRRGMAIERPAYRVWRVGETPRRTRSRVNDCCRSIRLELLQADGNLFRWGPKTSW